VSSVYDLAEEIIIGAPLGITTPTPCDVRECNNVAEHVIPGAALCGDCADGYGAFGGGVYDVPITQLVGGEAWREARWEEYLETLMTLREIGGARGRTPEDDLKVAEILRLRADHLITSVLGGGAHE
jgi:hypothetical protein